MPSTLGDSIGTEFEDGQRIALEERDQLRDLLSQARIRLDQHIGMCACPGEACVSSCRECNTDGRGPYAWDDERYKDEAGQALRSVIAIGKKALNDSGDLIDSAFHPEAPKVVMWGGRPMKVGRCEPGRTCLACDRLGKHLEPAEQT